MDARLVMYRSVGTRNIYHVDPAGLAELRAYLDSLWENALLNLKAVAEESYLRVKKTNDKKGKKRT